MPLKSLCERCWHRLSLQWHLVSLMLPAPYICLMLNVRTASRWICGSCLLAADTLVRRPYVRLVML